MINAYHIKQDGDKLELTTVSDKYMETSILTNIEFGGTVGNSTGVRLSCDVNSNGNDYKIDVATVITNKKIIPLPPSYQIEGKGTDLSHNVEFTFNLNVGFNKVKLVLNKVNQPTFIVDASFEEVLFKLVQQFMY